MDKMAGKHKLHNRRISWSAFLKDVVICFFGAYGGPEAHFGVFIDQLVVKKKYLKEEEFVELIALCGMLPGPTSTQTIVSIGYKLGGPLLAFFTFLIWAVPVLTVMTILSFSFVFLEAMNLSEEGLRFIGPMAVGFILVAAYRIGLRVIKDRLTVFLFLFGATSTYFVRDPWVFPLVLLVGGILSVVESKKDELWTRITISPPWPFMIVFLFWQLGAAWHY